MKNKPVDAPHFSQLMKLVPDDTQQPVDWAKIWTLWPELPVLDACPQDQVHHGEGDAGIHTRMVVEALVSDDNWQRMEGQKRAGLFWAAVLHDVGKPGKTVHEENGRITSRGHSRLGAAIARRLLWQAEAPFNWREAICGLIEAHQLPFWLIERADPKRLAIRTSWQCLPEDLCIHAHADAQGRVCQDQEAIIDNVALARAIFEENDCLHQRFSFANDESRVAFFEKEDRDPHFAAHEAFRCHVTVMAGLPGSGKDTWLSKCRPEIPVVSLDGIRAETGAKATGNQGTVIQTAQDRVKEFLRKRQDFAWNATNISRNVRSKILRLLRDYGAHIHIVYIERSPDVLFRQNADRDAAVPLHILKELVRKLEPPELWETHQVSYVVDA
ncbi:MAG: AAA family ATPase [Stappiaceae bacterium]